MLRALKGEKFYHFVYHDGILEGLDNRVKLNLLDLIRENIEEKGIQYIISIIDSDLPRDEDENRIPFAEEEMILTLNDGGNDGRLFKVPRF